MATPAQWIEGARLKTLPAAAAPVIVGACAAYALSVHPVTSASDGAHTEFSWLRAILALITALALQVGANYSNDYSDGVRGTDNEHRVGPQRLTGPGLASPRAVLSAAIVSWIIAGIAGLTLIVLSRSWWLMALGVLCFIAAWFYTGGKNPYGYRPGVAEIMVFVFFGLFATVGTTWTNIHVVTWHVWLAACGVGVLSCALLLINNLRDLDTDTQSHKRTLCVALGDARSRRLYEIYMAVAVLCAFFSQPSMAGKLCTVVFMVGALLLNRDVKRGARGAQLIVTLKKTGLLTLAYGIIVGGGMVLGAVLG